MQVPKQKTNNKNKGHALSGQHVMNVRRTSKDHQVFLPRKGGFHGNSKRGPCIGTQTCMNNSENKSLANKSSVAKHVWRHKRRMPAGHRRRRLRVTIY